MGRTKQYTAQEVIDALKGTGGIVGTVAKKLECTTRTVQNYIAEYPTVKEAWRSERLAMRSMAEITVLKQAQSGSLKAAMFILNQLDPETGEFKPPTMRNEHTGKDGGPMRVVLEYVNDWRAVGAPEDN